MLTYMLDAVATTASVPEIQVLAVKAGFYWFTLVGLFGINRYAKYKMEGGR